MSNYAKCMVLPSSRRSQPWRGSVQFQETIDTSDDQMGPKLHTAFLHYVILRYSHILDQSRLLKHLMDPAEGILRRECRAPLSAGQMRRDVRGR